MNGVEHIVKAFGRGIDKLTSVFGNWGSSQPLDDSKSGIVMNGKTYQVIVSMNGCYWYLDENGKKQSIAQIPNTVEWEWVNIAEKVLKDFRTCYRTLGGKVEVWSWYLLNDEMDVLKERHQITDSTDMDNPVGSQLESIPASWVMIDCDLPDMTERDITPVNRCYKTPGGKVEIEGLESIDDKISIRESAYRIIQSTDEAYPAGREFSLIPANWNRTVCDFPDMTERDIIPVDECYNTGEGKVHFIGYRSIDNIIGTRQEYLIISQSTDENVKRNTTYTSIPGGWERIVCDFADLTTADTEIVENCYKTNLGKVHVRTYMTLDGEGKLRDSRHVVLRSTDQFYDTGTNLAEIPAGWFNVECDFASLTQRHTEAVKGCYKNQDGELYLEGIKVFDNNLKTEIEKYNVIESTIEYYSAGSVMNSIPDDFIKINCKCNCGGL